MARHASVLHVDYITSPAKLGLEDQAFNIAYLVLSSDSKQQMKQEYVELLKLFDVLPVAHLQRRLVRTTALYTLTFVDRPILRWFITQHCDRPKDWLVSLILAIALSGEQADEITLHYSI